MGQLEIAALSEKYHIDIRVFAPNGPPALYPAPEDPQCTFALLYRGYHYEYLHGNIPQTVLKEAKDGNEQDVAAGAKKPVERGGMQHQGAESTKAQPNTSPTIDILPLPSESPITMPPHQE